VNDRHAIVVEDLWEVFRIYRERPTGLKERFVRRRTSYTEFTALQGVSLTIRHGESVGLVGHNGSGKSTLLRCLARILPPDRGTVTVNGRIATLLELGAGFHPDLSGRENVYLNGAILGLSRREVEAQFDSIVDFAGVREFIDTPVRNYSSGMYVRLGFAIAVHVDPDILLVDEVLSVGDAAFQEKSLARMRSFSQRGKTVVLVSHDLEAVQALCERVVVLDHGRVVFDGETEEGVEFYDELIHGKKEAPPPPEPDPVPVEAEEPGRNGDFRAAIRDVRVTVDGREVGDEALPGGNTAAVSVEVEARDDLVPDGGLTVGLNIRRPDMGLYVYETRTSWRVLYVAPPPPGETFRVTYELDLHLLTGTYLVDLLVANATTNVIHDRWQAARSFEVRTPEYEFGVAALDARIRIDNPEGIWPPESHPPPLEEGGPRFHPVRDGAST
jgi:ABC-type polysaccharide/polyol phosphate transport system ATPase subunit